MYLALFFLGIVFAILYNIGKSKRLKALKQRYDQSLKGVDKRIALAAGRA